MTTTTNFGWTLPTVGGDSDVWGTTLNTDLSAIDTLLGSGASGGTVSCNKLSLGGATIGTNALAVTGTSQFNGSVTTTGRITQSLSPVAAEYALRSTGQTTGWIAIDMANTGGDYIIAGENSTGNNIITGDSAYDMCIRGPSAIAFSANAGASQQMRLTSAGNVGLNTSTPQDSSGSGYIYYSASGSTGSGFAVQVAGTTKGYLYGNASGINLYTNAAIPILFGVNNAEVARFDTSGNLLVGITSGGRNTIRKNVSQDTGTPILQVDPAASVGVFYVCGTSVNAWNGANSCAFVPKDGTTSRSINAGGTINASGADYAEYMLKADSCGVLAKGDITGVNADGKLTDKFADAHSFVIKSTDPSYVGGDTWGTEELLGKSPKHEGQLGDETEEQHQGRIVAFEAALEAARQTVDRIAFSGQVPVNVTGATVGDYIVPVAGPDGGIAGEAVTNPTFDQYRAAVGRVWKILEDGRAFVSVKVS